MWLLDYNDIYWRNSAELIGSSQRATDGLEKYIVLWLADKRSANCGQTECELMGFSLILYIKIKWLDLYMYTIVPVHGDCTYLLNCIFYLILPTPCVCVCRITIGTSGSTGTPPSCTSCSGQLGRLPQIDKSSSHQIHVVHRTHV